jgi:ATP-binding protein involved in chromosome partitioning
LSKNYRFEFRPNQISTADKFTDGVKAILMPPWSDIRILTASGRSENNSNLSIICKDGHANISLNINQQDQEKYTDLSKNLKNALSNINALLSVNIIFTSEKTTDPESKEHYRFQISAKNIIAIASGKGGVGKSTFAVNFAVALKKLGYQVGILDADIYGPSVPRMMGITGRPQTNDNKKLIPLESYGIKCMSIGFLIGVDTPTIWRGPMVM